MFSCFFQPIASKKKAHEESTRDSWQIFGKRHDMCLNVESQWESSILGFLGRRNLG